MIWKILILEPDIVILDEIDKALDKDTAVHILSWIIKNVPSFFILVTHLSEVKDALLTQNVINQIWNYDLTDKVVSKIKITNI